MQELIIDPEFKRLIPPQTPEEHAGLEAMIIAEGCRDPLITWGGTLVDGHNRYEICTRLNIPFETREMFFDDVDAVMVWIIDNQLSRRNLQPIDRVSAVEKKRDILEKQARARQGERNDLKPDFPVNLPESGDESDWSDPPEKKRENEVNEQLAQSVGVSRKTYEALKEVNETGSDALKDVVRQKDVGASTAQVIATLPHEEQDEIVAKGRDEILRAAKEIQQAKQEEKRAALEAKKAEILKVSQAELAEVKPTLYHQPCSDFLATLANKSQDLLITDPPYSTDVDDIESFVDSWLDDALAKVKDSGRAYICIGAYPKELSAYLSRLNNQTRFIVDNPLIWTYRNTLGVTPKRKYNLNYQVILHLYTDQSPDLDTSITNEMFSVQDINAPDGRLGNRYHTWQKPDELAIRLIRHSTTEGASVFDPFSCTGTFAIAAAKLNRIATGCDISRENLSIAESRGCSVI